MRFEYKTCTDTEMSCCAAQAERQAELAYTVDFQMVMLERRVARAAGQHTEDEAAELHAKIGSLQEQLARTLAEHALVSAQLKHAEDSLGALCFNVQ